MTCASRAALKLAKSKRDKTWEAATALRVKKFARAIRLALDDKHFFRLR
jgi:hypothetical protein